MVFLACMLKRLVEPAFTYHTAKISFRAVKKSVSSDANFCKILSSPVAFLSQIQNPEIMASSTDLKLNPNPTDGEFALIARTDAPQKRHRKNRPQYIFGNITKESNEFFTNFHGFLSIFRFQIR